MLIHNFPRNQHGLEARVTTAILQRLQFIWTTRLRSKYNTSGMFALTTALIANPFGAGYAIAHSSQPYRTGMLHLSGLLLSIALNLYAFREVRNRSSASGTVIVKIGLAICGLWLTMWLLAFAIWTIQCILHS